MSKKGYTTSCAASNHNYRAPGSADLVPVFPERRKGVSVAVFNWFFENGEINSKRKSSKSMTIYVCRACLNRASASLNSAECFPSTSRGLVSSQERMDVDTAENLPMKTVIDLTQVLDFIGNITQIEDARTVEAVIKRQLVKLNCMDVDEAPGSKSQLDGSIRQIGGLIRSEVQSAAKYSPAERLGLLKTATYESTWEKTSPTFKVLLEEITTGAKKTENSTKYMVKASECLKLLLDSDFISPLSHAEALLVLQYSHSRYAVDVFSHSQAGGSYSTIKRTIKSLGTSEKPIQPGDIIIGFDNNQTVQRTWSMQLKGKQKSTIVTSLVLFQTTEYQDFQYRFKLPTYLDVKQSEVGNLLKRYELFRKDADKCMTTMNQTIVEKRLKFLREKGNMQVDDFGESGFGNGLSYDIVSKGNTTYSVLDWDCLPLNPSSTASVKLILDEILKLKKKDQRRNWVLAYMDGGPFGLAKKLIANTFVCKTCKMDSIENKEEHVDTHHFDSPDLIRFARMFEGIIIRPGCGHVEMLVVKCVLTTFWEPFFQPIAVLMGHKSPASLEFCRKGGDHHRSWELITVVFVSLLDEILSQFNKECGREKTTDSKAFFDFCKLRCETNKTFKLTFSFVFDVLTPLFVFRSAIRQGNDDVALLSRECATRLLFGSSHPKYHQILAYDTLYLLTLSLTERKVVAKESCRTNKSDIGQAFDFIVEERNKKQKAFLPADGAPTFSQWKDVVDSMHELEKIQEITIKRLGMTLQASTQRKRELAAEKKETRNFFKENFGFDMKIKNLLTTSTGHEIHDQFTEFSTLCRQNQMTYFNNYLHGTISHLPIINNVVFPATLDEMTKEQLNEKAKALIQTLEEPFFTFYQKAFRRQSTIEEVREFYLALLRIISWQENLMNDNDE